MYEYEIEALIAYGFRKHHGTEAFSTIVASGLNACTLHYTKNTRQIKEDDLVLLDFESNSIDMEQIFLVHFL